MIATGERPELWPKITGSKNLARQQLKDDEQDRGQQQHFPAGSHCGSENERKNRRDECADVGHKPQNHCNETPQWGRGHADKL